MNQTVVHWIEQCVICSFMNFELNESECVGSGRKYQNTFIKAILKVVQ